MANGEIVRSLLLSQKRYQSRSGSVAIEIGNAVSCILSGTVLNLKMVRPYFIRFTFIGYIGSMA